MIWRCSVAYPRIGKRSASSYRRFALWKRCEPASSLKQHQVVTQLAGSNNNQDRTPTGAGVRLSGSHGQPLAAATEPRARRRKSKAQQLKSVEKLQHKWLKRRCEAAATKAGGSPPKVLARVLACCGRFFELHHPDSAVS